MKRSLAFAALAVAVAFPLGIRAASPSPVGTLMSKLHWRSIGPYVGGRVVAIAGVPSEPDLFYMGGVEGGVWRSTNYGQSWENITDGKIPGIADSIGAIAVAPSNPSVIYVGTGESDIRGDFDTGAGIYKSTDAGKTWHYAGLRDTHQTSSLVIDPRNPNVVYATSMGHVFAPNARRGVFKTTDGGRTWRRILFVNDRTGANDLVMDAHNPNILYATMWQAQRTPWELVSGGPGSGLYKSIDAGAHWTKISSNPGFARGVLGKMGVAVAPTDPHVVYAIVQAHHGGVFRSGNGGATWTRVNGQWFLRQRAFYYMAIYVNPTNANTVYAPEVDSVWQSKNGGRTWTPLMHPGDHHIIWINPYHPKIMLEGDDGGATVSVDGGKTWSTELNQPTGQFYHITLDNQFPYHVYGAQQDSGPLEGPSASNLGLGIGGWRPVALGESTFIAVDPRDPNVTYGSGYYSSFARLNTATGEEKIVSPWPLYLTGASSGELRYRFGWTHPILFSPVNPDELFICAQVVFKSDDFGQTWRVISPDLTRNVRRTEVPSGGPVDLDQSGVEIFPDIASLAISPFDGNVIWAGSADGLVHVTTNGGAQWRLVTPPQLPQWAEISSIEPSRTAAGTAYLTASRYKWDDFHPYVYKTTDYGAHWATLTNGLPRNQYVFVVREDPRDPRVLLAGTRSTVYVSLNEGARWRPLTLDLPGVQVRDIAVDARQGEVAIATHGRGFWILDDLALLEQLASERNADLAQAMLFSPETAWLSHAYGGGGFGDSGENPAYGATVYFNIPPSYNGRTPVTLAFLDANGKTVRRYALHLAPKRAQTIPGYLYDQMPRAAEMRYDLAKATTVARGINAFQWNMCYAPATEVNGLHVVTTDDYSDFTTGPTIVPGTYTVVLQYGNTRIARTFAVKLDPRLHPAPDELDARLALATQIRDTLDALDRTVNAALAARSRLAPQRRAQVNAEIAQLVQFKVHSSEGDLLNELKLRDHLAFLMNELDLAYQAPTQAEQATYDGLAVKAQAAIARLHVLLSDR